MKNKILLHSFRKIKDNFKRFISLFFMAMLGVGFFVGIKSTSPSMIATLDKFLNKNNVYDLEIVSTLGLTDDDIVELSKISGVSKVVGSNFEDNYLSINDKEYVLRMLEVTPEINNLYVKSGRLPKSRDEVVVEEGLLTDNDLSLGDFITIKGEKLNKFKIVGVVVSPIYFSVDRGISNIGNGRVKYYAYTSSDILNNSYYTQIYITLSNTKKLVTNSLEYKKEVLKVKNKISKIKDKLEDRRFDEVYGEKIKYAKAMGISPNISKFPKAKIIINDRSDSQAYTDLIDASLNVNKLGNVFPLVFYVIAILISLITMMRMVEEDRMENGTLKALGYKTEDILVKYLLFSVAATITGGMIGVFIGCNLIPKIIWDIYQMMFSIPNFCFSINLLFTLIGIGVALICICGSAIWTCISNICNIPATLMRPKAPKNGKRVLLENITFIWNKFNFSQKIIIRNIFRYKSRVVATIIGITGCTALILAGFGLRDAIRDVVSYQYERVFHYDRMLVTKNSSLSMEMEKYLEERYEINKTVPCRMNDSKVKYKNNSIDTILVVSDDFKKFDEVVSLFDIDNKRKKIIPHLDGVVISEKTRTLLDVEVGQKITVNVDGKIKKLRVSNVVENYIEHYIYLNSETYEKYFGNYLENTFLLKLDDKISKKNIDRFDEELLKVENVRALVNVGGTIDMVEKTLESLNSVVVVLIVASALLAFVVLYNLSNINISEREREIATLKVLGFYNKEVDNYITKENIILTIMGIVLGLILGGYLSNFIVSTCEPNPVMFVRKIELSSYFISSLITVLFTGIVNLITHFSLLKIDMIESLKNVE